MIGESNTKKLFNALRSLYQQSSQLLLDADRLMGERDYTPINNYSTTELSYSISNPDRWFARWAFRYYIPIDFEKNGDEVNHLYYVSIQFDSDSDTNVEDSYVTGGKIFFKSPQSKEQAAKFKDYWICKSWEWGNSKYNNEFKEHISSYARETEKIWCFKVDLFDIDSPETLEKKVIDVLMNIDDHFVDKKV
jgi:hypothetical protein